MVILDKDTLIEITNFIRNYRGLPIDCEHELPRKFPKYNAETLGSILAKEWQIQIKTMHASIASNSRKYLQEYEKQAQQNKRNEAIILNIAMRLSFSPISLCRILLSEKFKQNLTKSEISDMLKNPNSIPNIQLALNVSHCLFNDSRDGPIPDIIRQCVGEEYEVRLKQMATEAGMSFYDENDLRRTGFDKTPDLKLAVPFLHRGKIIYWIESKATFGDMESHQKYIRDQLSSYVNRFGAGIVIYWFGYFDEIANWKENGDSVVVMDGFPKQEDLEFLKF